MEVTNFKTKQYEEYESSHKIVFRILRVTENKLFESLYIMKTDLNIRISRHYARATICSTVESIYIYIYRNRPAVRYNE